MNNKKITKEFKKMVLSKARIKVGTSADNIKLGNMGSWAMLFGDCEWYIPEVGMSCKGTCGKHCKGCFDPKNPKKSPCYVAKSYTKYTKRNEDGTKGNILTNECSVKLGHFYRTFAMLYLRDELLESLDKQLTGMKKKLGVVRINESGELTCAADLQMWVDLAQRHSETVFYLYTKNYKAVREVIQGYVPSNIFINISVWHKQGIKEYNEMKDHPQIRAFVYVDKEWTVVKYMEKGLQLNSMCGAYNEKGKMNHAVTCDKCKKCFSQANKCVGCYSH